MTSSVIILNYYEYIINIDLVRELIMRKNDQFSLLEDKS